MPPSPALGLIVVIPCHDEPRLHATLGALSRCFQPRCDVEVIVVVNACERDQPSVHRRNRQSLLLTQSFGNGRARDARGVRFHALYFPRLPVRDAGVGLARKLGMDEALARFCRIGNPRGVIACLDADCLCDRNYLQSIEAHFHARPHTSGCSIYFEHPLAGLSAEHAQAIVRYELSLRYYRHGLRFSGYPYAFYTIGSCMAVPADVYAQQGGMNRRSAGEDFHFLRKVMTVGGFSELCSTRVLPSSRLSSRTSFGTGRSVAAQLAGGSFAAGQRALHGTYSPRAFYDIRALVGVVPRLFRTTRSGRALGALPTPLASFLEQHGFAQRIEEVRANCATVDSFAKRFYRWFDPLRAFRYIRWSTLEYYGSVSLARAARTVAGGCGGPSPSCGAEPDLQALLQHFRYLDRRGAPSAPE